MIREFRADDLEPVLDVWCRASIVAHFFLPDGFFAAEREMLRSRWLPSADTTVYVAEKKVVGFLSLIGNEVGGLFVDPEYQRRGIGRALMDGAREVCPILELSVFEENHAGLSFYRAYGFDVIGRQINDGTGQPELRLRLSPA